QTMAWIGGLTPAELAGPVTVNGLDGRPLSTYLTAVVMHGITELTAAAAILEQLGQPVGDLGLLDFLDEVAPVAGFGAVDAHGAHSVETEDASRPGSEDR